MVRAGDRQPAPEANVADAAEEQTITMVKLQWRGKTYQMTEADARAGRQAVVDALRPYVESLDRHLKLSISMHEEYLETAQLKNGVLKAVSQMVVMKVASIDFPSTSLSARATSALTRAQGAMSESRVAQLGPALQEAEAAINAYRDDIARYLEQMGASAQATGTALTVTSAAGFAILGAWGAAALAPIVASEAAAAAMSAAAVKVMQSGAEELGKAALGQDVTAWQSVSRVVLDGVVAFITGGIAGKVKPELLGPITKRAAASIASRVTSMTVDQIDALLLRYLAGPGVGVATTAVNQVLETVAEMVKKGRAPTEKELSDYLQNFLIGLLASGFMKTLELGEGKLGGRLSQLFETKLVPDAVKRIATATVSSTEIRKIAVEVVKKLTEDAMKAAGNHIAGSARGNESADGLAALGEAGITADSRLRQAIDAEVKAQLKKRSIATR